ncbi:unnamed protein product, partial [Phaeothamnion confervicola]
TAGGARGGAVGSGGSGSRPVTRSADGRRSSAPVAGGAVRRSAAGPFVEAMGSIMRSIMHRGAGRYPSGDSEEEDDMLSTSSLESDDDDEEEAEGGSGGGGGEAGETGGQRRREWRRSSSSGRRSRSRQGRSDMTDELAALL